MQPTDQIFFQCDCQDQGATITHAMVQPGVYSAWCAASGAFLFGRIARDGGLSRLEFGSGGPSGSSITAFRVTGDGRVMEIPESDEPYFQDSST